MGDPDDNLETAWKEWRDSIDGHRWASPWAKGIFIAGYKAGHQAAIDRANSAMSHTIAETKTNGTSLPPITDAYLKPEELALQLGVSLRTIARWTALGIGPRRVVIGKLILFNRESVSEWLREREDRPRRRNGR